MPYNTNIIPCAVVTRRQGWCYETRLRRDEDLLESGIQIVTFCHPLLVEYLVFLRTLVQGHLFVYRNIYRRKFRKMLSLVKFRLSMPKFEIVFI